MGPDRTMGKHIRLTELERERMEQVFAYSLGVAEERREWGRAAVLLAQGLRGIKTLAALSWRQVLPLLEQWIEDIGDVTSGAEPDAVIEKFADAWGKVREPFRFLSTEEVNRALGEGVKKPCAEAEAIAKDIYPSMPIMRVLLAALIAARDLNGGETFYLPTRKGAEVLGLGADGSKRVGVLLRLLVNDGVLGIAEAGTTHRAPRYTWKAVGYEGLEGGNSAESGRE